jgi:CRP-like cAMP-binding protein
MAGNLPPPLGRHCHGRYIRPRMSDDRARAAAILARAEWLTQAGADLAERFLAHGRIVRLQPAQWVQAEGDDEAGLLMVLDGALQLFCKAPGDREVLVGQIGAGAALGQTTRFGGGPRLVTAIAVGGATILQVSDRALSRIAHEAPHVWQAVSALLYRQLRNLLELVGELAALPPRERLARRLCLMAGGPSGPHLRITQEALGEMVGLTRKTANLHLAAFEREGLVRRAYGGLTVTDLAALARVAGE